VESYVGYPRPGGYAINQHPFNRKSYQQKAGTLRLKPLPAFLLGLLIGLSIPVPWVISEVINRNLSISEIACQVVDLQINYRRHEREWNQKALNRWLKGQRDFKPLMSREKRRIGP
jgi:hypothetical protein